MSLTFITTATATPPRRSAAAKSAVHPPPTTLLPSVSPPVPLPALLARLPSFDLRGIPLSPTPSFPYTMLPPFISRPLCKLAAAHISATGRAPVTGRVALVRGRPCPKWHVDKVRFRGLATLHGPGVEILIMEGGQPDEEQSVAVRTGDAVLMRGAGIDAEHMRDAVWHRSPGNETGVRLIVQTDCADCI